MIKLAICDDERSVIEELRELFDQYAVERGEKLSYEAYQSPLDLLAEIEHGVHYDVLFMDILMPGETGIKAAEEIRQHDSNVKIIFLTSSAEFAVQSYTVGAYYYQMKPVCRERIFNLLDCVIAAIEKEQQRSIILRTKNGITRVNLKCLEYCEVIHHTLFLHLTDGRILESTGSMDDLHKQLELYGGFFRPHRSYLVNLDYVQTLSYKNITMSSLAQIPIPRGKYHEIKDAYLDHAFQSGRVIL